MIPIEDLNAENERLKQELDWTNNILKQQEIQAKQQVQALKDNLKKSLRLEIDDYKELKKSYTENDIEFAMVILDNIISTLKKYGIE